MAEEHRKNPKGDEASEAVAGLRRNTQRLPEQQRLEGDQHYPAQKAHLLANHGEDKVSVLHRHIVALAEEATGQPRPEPTALANRTQRLDHVIAIVKIHPRRIGEEEIESQQAPPLVVVENRVRVPSRIKATHGKEQKAQQLEGLDPRTPGHHQPDRPNHDGATHIRLDNHEQRGNKRNDQSTKLNLPTVSLAFKALPIGGQGDNQG